MNTITQQFNTIVEHPKFERRTFWMLVFLLSVLISTYGIFLGKTVVSVIERRVSESDMEKIASNVSVLETNYLKLSTNIDISVAKSYGFVESKKTAYATRGGDIKSFAFRP